MLAFSIRLLWKFVANQRIWNGSHSQFQFHSTNFIEWLLLLSLLVFPTKLWLYTFDFVAIFHECYLFIFSTAFPHQGHFPSNSYTNICAGWRASKRLSQLLLAESTRLHYIDYWIRLDVLTSTKSINSV